MIDPTTLRAGEVVLFGDIEMPPVDKDGIGEFGVWFGPDCEWQTYIGFKDDLWRLAERKKRKLPSIIGYGFTLNEQGEYRYTGCPCSPETLLEFCREVVYALQAAGIEEAE